MKTNLVNRANARTIAITAVNGDAFKDWKKNADAAAQAWATATGFSAKAGEMMLRPAADGRLAEVLLGIEGDDLGLWDLAELPGKLPAGRYKLSRSSAPKAATAAALGWALGCYRFNRYKSAAATVETELVWPVGADRRLATAQAEGIALARDLINTPAGDLGPSHLATAARKLARQHKASCTVIVGDDLLKKNYPAVHAVGRAAANAPRLIDITWGQAKAPKVTLVGKGVCFDSGGLDIKPSSGMLLMKKDMGGAAQALALAHMIMALELPIRLRVLVPAVENAISGNAFRPLDVLDTRKGLTVEVGNTDAEGRLILCDALAEADRDKPELLFDFATLTGAARVALGTDLPALFCNDDQLAEDLTTAGIDTADPMWRLPLWPGYKAHLKSPVADLSSTGSGGFGGAITAALFLEHFVAADRPWVHIDLMAWNRAARPGRPEGGEAMTVRAIFDVLQRRYG
jgi:leucyl aminopeptidase